MLSKLENIIKNQKGFTFIELIIAVAITGLIVGGITLTIIQLFGGHAQSSGEMTTLRQVQNAGYHISRDAQMAETVDTSDDPGTEDITEILTVIWTEYHDWKSEPVLDEEDNIIGYVSPITKHKIIYTLDDNRLDRHEYRTPVIREDEPIEYSLYSVTRVAQYITLCEYNQDSNVLTVTATTGGFKSQTETRTYEINPRPDTILWQ